MKTTLSFTLWFLLAAPAARNAQEKSPQDCLQYEPATVTLKGTINRKTFPGPPEYASVKKGDEPETVWILHVNPSICVAAGADDLHEPEKNVSNLELVWDKVQYARNRKLLNHWVVITGKLFHRFSGHHHTKVLIQVSQINGLKAPAAARPVVPTTRVSGVTLRRPPAETARVMADCGLSLKRVNLQRAHST